MSHNHGPVRVIHHPLVQHKLSLLRMKETSVSKFRMLVQELSLLLAYELTRDLPLEMRPIETPIAPMDSPFLEGKKLVFISILRAGNGLLDGMVQLIPSARVGHIGLYRDPKTLEPVEYYFKVPSFMSDRHVIIVDPMLATGHSAAFAVERIKTLSPKSIKFLCLLAAPEGLKCFHGKHPEVEVFTAAVDSHLNDKGYIVPGLGDAGDRLFGTVHTD